MDSNNEKLRFLMPYTLLRGIGKYFHFRVFSQFFFSKINSKLSKQKKWPKLSENASKMLKSAPKYSYRSKVLSMLFQVWFMFLEIY